MHITVQVTGVGFRYGLQVRVTDAYYSVIGMGYRFGLQAWTTGTGYQFFIWKLRSSCLCRKHVTHVAIFIVPNFIFNDMK